MSTLLHRTHSGQALIAAQAMDSYLEMVRSGWAPGEMSGLKVQAGWWRGLYITIRTRERFKRGEL